MIDWFVWLTPLLLLPVLLLLGFVGCQFHVTGLLPSFGQPGDIPVEGDYFGTGKTQVAFFHPADGSWNIFGQDIFDSFIVDHPELFSNFVVTFTFGQAGDIPVPGDYDGNGTTKPAFYRPSEGKLHIADVSFNVTTNVATVAPRPPIGLPGPTSFSSAQGDRVLPPGDYLGDGRILVGTFGVATGQWFIADQTGTTQRVIVGFGQHNDIPVPGDYDGSGTFQPVLFRPLDGWHFWDLALNTENQVLRPASLILGDIPLPPAVYVKPGPNPGARTTGVHRPGAGTFILTDLIGNSREISVVLPGASGDLPAPGAYDGAGNGLVDAVVFRPTDGTWHRADFTVIGGS